MPAKAGIQAFLLDSRQKHAGMTPSDDDHFNCAMQYLTLSFWRSILFPRYFGGEIKWRK
jgi:hypothetical protein